MSALWLGHILVERSQHRFLAVHALGERAGEDRQQIALPLIALLQQRENGGSEFFIGHVCSRSVF